MSSIPSRSSSGTSTVMVAGAFDLARMTVGAETSPSRLTLTINLSPDGYRPRGITPEAVTSPLPPHSPRLKSGSCVR